MERGGLVKASHVYAVLCAVELLLVGALFFDLVYLRDRPKMSSQVWVSIWGGGGRDYARGVAVSDGSIYVTGDTTSYGSGDENVFLLKYGYDGGLIWNRTWGEEEFSMGRGIAASGGFVYVCGIRYAENMSSALLIKFDEEGSPLWSREWRSGSDAYGRGVALDPSGSIYVVGYTRGNRSVTQSFLLKYGPDGSFNWSRLFNESESETGWAVTVEDGVYLCSTTGVGAAQAVSTAAPRTRMTLRKLGYGGGLQWSRAWGTGLENYGLAVASQGGRVLQAGFARLTNGTAKVALLEYTPDGSLIHTSLIGNPPESIGWGVTAVGPYVYVVGQQMSPSYMDAKDAITAKVGDGDVIWSRTWGGYGDDVARSVAVDGDHIYVAGITYGVGEGGQVFLIAYASPNPPWSLAALIEPASLVVGTALITTVAIEYVRRRAHRGSPMSIR
jgi:hypothetical protein